MNDYSWTKTAEYQQRDLLRKLDHEDLLRQAMAVPARDALWQRIRQWIGAEQSQMQPESLS